MLKRVWALYRVSTDKQVDENDIPMQKHACREFVKQNKNWKLEKELLELGISGFKKSARDRDAIETLRRSALNKEFDVILVFMYDRLGRRHEETPFIVEWFVKQGIEVWSVKEGQRKFDSHVDSLTNYITFWQASGESIKTSIRTTEKISQLNEEGYYTGGTPPYGYEAYDTGIKHPKKDKNIKKLRINETEKEMIKIMFDLVVTKGYGSQRVAQWLNENGYTLRNGSKWKSNYVSRILRNPIVIGYKRYGYMDNNLINWDRLKLQPFNKDLVMIDEADFKITQSLLDKRNTRSDKKDQVTAPTKSKLLLSGIVKCGYCGGNLSADYSIKTNTRKNGEVTKSTVNRYTCKNGKSYRGNHVSLQFGAKKYENEVEITIKEFIENVNKETFIEEMAKFQKNNVKIKKDILEKHKKEIEKHHQQLFASQKLLLKVELGESKLSSAMVEDMILEEERNITEKQQLIENLEKEIDNEIDQLRDYEQVLDEFDDWIVIYQAADLDSKKMMLSRIIKHLSFKKDEIDIELILPLKNAQIEESEILNMIDYEKDNKASSKSAFQQAYKIIIDEG